MTTSTQRRIEHAAGNEDEVVRARIKSDLKAEAVQVLDGLGMTVSDLMRETLIRVVQDRAVPFSVRTRTGVIGIETKHKLDVMFAPELHRVRWAERLAQLTEARHAASTPAGVEAAKSAIREHMKHEYDTDQTRRALAVERANPPTQRRARSR
ncbi:MAG: type II toxin-antitoxin system RelB/DinJ family antitoxin [Proteobacteria bacterium]|nr:type II toxin-antitoxin system RelB/DinJ family antitoxin [Pseudomonadota bacterium]